MVILEKPKSSGWGGTAGLAIKIGYFYLNLQRGRWRFNANVAGEAAMVRVFLNVGGFNRIFYAGYGKLPHRNGAPPFARK